MTHRPKSKLTLFFAATYLLLVLAQPLFAAPGESLAGIFAVLIIQPWSSILVWLTDFSGIDGMFFNWVILLLCAILNTWLIYKSVSWVVSKIS